MAGRWENYAMQHNEALGQLFNRSIQQTLRTGLRVLLDNTRMDSGRAAAHWIIKPQNPPGGMSPNAWAQNRFPNPNYGKTPVGQPNDKKGTDPAVVSHVMAREQRRAIEPSVRTRRPATRFIFHNATPAALDEGLGGRHPQHYQDNARLVEAIDAASSQMKVRFNQLMARGAVRKRPLR